MFKSCCNISYDSVYVYFLLFSLPLNVFNYLVEYIFGSGRSFLRRVLRIFIVLVCVCANFYACKVSSYLFRSWWFLYCEVCVYTHVHTCAAYQSTAAAVHRRCMSPYEVRIVSTVVYRNTVY